GVAPTHTYSHNTDAAIIDIFARKQVSRSIGVISNDLIGIIVVAGRPFTFSVVARVKCQNGIARIGKALCIVRQRLFLDTTNWAAHDDTCRHLPHRNAERAIEMSSKTQPITVERDGFSTTGISMQEHAGIFWQ